MSNKNYEKQNSSKGAYVYGNTVRNLSTAEPAARPQKRERKVEEQETREDLQKQREIQRAHKMNFLYTVGVVGVVAFMFTICIQYLGLQTNAKNNASDVSKLESTLTELTAKNDMTEVEINGSIDYNAILNTAVNELKMVYPSRSQVIQYDSSESQYVKQYADIPAAK